MSGWHCKVILCTEEKSNCKLCVSKAGPDLAHLEGPAHLLDVTHALLWQDVDALCHHAQGTVQEDGHTPTKLPNQY